MRPRGRCAARAAWRGWRPASRPRRGCRARSGLRRAARATHRTGRVPSSRPRPVRPGLRSTSGTTASARRAVDGGATGARARVRTGATLRPPARHARPRVPAVPPHGRAHRPAPPRRRAAAAAPPAACCAVRAAAVSTRLVAGSARRCAAQRQRFDRFGGRRRDRHLRAPRRAARGRSARLRGPGCRRPMHPSTGRAAAAACRRRRGCRRARAAGSASCARRSSACRRAPVPAPAVRSTPPRRGRIRSWARAARPARCRPPAHTPSRNAPVSARAAASPGGATPPWRSARAWPRSSVRWHSWSTVRGLSRRASARVRLPPHRAHRPGRSTARAAAGWCSSATPPGRRAGSGG